MPFFVDKQTGDPTGTRVEILVGAPDRKVHVPVMQRQRHVPDCVGKIPATDATLKKAN